MQRNRVVLFRYLLAFLFIAGMAAVSALTGEKEVFFPEMLALVAGGWAAAKQPWRAARPLIWGLMTFSALLGVVMVRYLAWPVSVKVIAAFVVVAVCLHLTGSTLYPMISACILPILLGVDTMVYPISVSVMTAVLVIGQFFLEKGGLRETAPVRETGVLTAASLKRGGWFWGKLYIALVPLAILAVGLGCPLLIAPPLLVAFTEFASPGGKLRSRPIAALLLLVGGGVMGTILRMGAEWVGAPVFLAAVLAAGVMLVLFRLSGFILPPAGAMALLPMLVEPAALPWYPLQTGIGCVVFFLLSLLLFPKKQETAQGLPAAESLAE